MTHPTDRLAEYAAGAGAPDIAAHLAGCAACRADLAAWQRLRAAERLDAAPPPGPELLAGVLRRVRAAPAAPPVLIAVPRYSGPNRPRRLLPVVGQLLAQQARLIRRPVWVLAGLAIAAGTVLAAAVPPGRAAGLFGLVVPPVAALIVAAGAGDSGPADELVRATPTSPRTVLLARLTLLLGSTVGAGLLATLLLATRDQLGAPGLLLAWFGPLVPLCALSLAVAVAWRPGAGMGLAMAIWMLKLLTRPGLLDARIAGAVATVWQPALPTVAAAVALAAAVVLAAPLLHRNRIRISGVAQ
ncbi:cupin domain-containing protein [Dactylosporangium matsuzakiense]|uniref:hypothetical protein n=1 Tax=Dactylosporangium matsuzakiense TaxID=53360 RepID=UPI0021C3567B|nr:hypothetical protein [Dactylosporangium matsuzakiense]UWZ48424.1 hypothetical protein Dmats_19640 [Dactylosporangium matsuzakiense]